MDLHAAGSRRQKRQGDLPLSGEEAKNAEYEQTALRLSLCSDEALVTVVIAIVNSCLRRSKEAAAENYEEWAASSSYPKMLLLLLECLATPKAMCELLLLLGTESSTASSAKKEEKEAAIQQLALQLLWEKNCKLSRQELVLYQTRAVLLLTEATKAVPIVDEKAAEAAAAVALSASAGEVSDPPSSVKSHGDDELLLQLLFDLVSLRPLPQQHPLQQQQQQLLLLSSATRRMQEARGPLPAKLQEKLLLQLAKCRAAAEQRHCLAVLELQWEALGLLQLALQWGVSSLQPAVRFRASLSLLQWCLRLQRWFVCEVHAGAAADVTTEAANDGGRQQRRSRLLCSTVAEAGGLVLNFLSQSVEQLLLVAAPSASDIFAECCLQPAGVAADGSLVVSDGELLLERMIRLYGAVFAADSVVSPDLVFKLSQEILPPHMRPRSAADILLQPATRQLLPPLLEAISTACRQKATKAQPQSRWAASAALSLSAAVDVPTTPSALQALRSCGDWLAMRLETLREAIFQLQGKQPEDLLIGELQQHHDRLEGQLVALLDWTVALWLNPPTGASPPVSPTADRSEKDASSSPPFAAAEESNGGACADLSALAPQQLMLQEALRLASKAFPPFHPANSFVLPRFCTKKDMATPGEVTPYGIHKPAISPFYVDAHEVQQQLAAATNASLESAAEVRLALVERLSDLLHAELHLGRSLHSPLKKLRLAEGTAPALAATASCFDVRGEDMRLLSALLFPLLAARPADQTLTDAMRCAFCRCWKGLLKWEKQLQQRQNGRCDGGVSALPSLLSVQVPLLLSSVLFAPLAAGSVAAAAEKAAAAKKKKQGRALKAVQCTREDARRAAADLLRMFASSVHQRTPQESDHERLLAAFLPFLSGRLVDVQQLLQQEAAFAASLQCCCSLGERGSLPSDPLLLHLKDAVQQHTGLAVREQEKQQTQTQRQRLPLPGELAGSLVVVGGALSEAREKSSCAVGSSEAPENSVASQAVSVVLQHFHLWTAAYCRDDDAAAAAQAAAAQPPLGEQPQATAVSAFAVYAQSWTDAMLLCSLEALAQALRFYFPAVLAALQSLPPRQQQQPSSQEQNKDSASVDSLLSLLIAISKADTSQRTGLLVLHASLQTVAFLGSLCAINACRLGSSEAAVWSQQYRRVVAALMETASLVSPSLRSAAALAVVRLVLELHRMRSAAAASADAREEAVLASETNQVLLLVLQLAQLQQLADSSEGKKAAPREEDAAAASAAVESAAAVAAEKSGVETQLAHAVFSSPRLKASLWPRVSSSAVCWLSALLLHAKHLPEVAALLLLLQRIFLSRVGDADVFVGHCPLSLLFSFSVYFWHSTVPLRESVEMLSQLVETHTGAAATWRLRSILHTYKERERKGESLRLTTERRRIAEALCGAFVFALEKIPTFKRSFFADLLATEVTHDASVRVIVWNPCVQAVYGISSVAELTAIGHDWTEIKPFFEDLWLSAARCLDDIVDEVRAAARLLGRTLRALTGELCCEGRPLVASVNLLQKVCEAHSGNKEIRILCLDVLGECVGNCFAAERRRRSKRHSSATLTPGDDGSCTEKKGGSETAADDTPSTHDTEAWLVPLVVFLIEGLGAFEPRAFAFHQFHAERLHGVSQKDFERTRVSLSQTGRAAKILKDIARQMDLSAVGSLIPPLVQKLRGSLGVASRCGVCFFVSSLFDEWGAKIPEVSVHAKRLLKALARSLLDPSPTVRGAAIEAFAVVCKFANSKAMQEVLEKQLLQLPSPDCLEVYERVETQLSVGNALLHVSRRASELFNAELRGHVAASAFCFRHSSSEAVAAVYRDLWTEVAASDAFGIPRYMAFIVDKLRLQLELSVREERLTAARAISTLAAQVAATWKDGFPSSVQRRTLSPFCGSLSAPVDLRAF
ncbi:hypothetical protein cyc_03395 [Cyclospora cayetanensis]|uniref:Proteasome adapter and scaffold protein ECM29 HEAT-repeat domain-containing protein n=1 Tax=Cyclospora cayetanensis TaxID=88456 RepID=A0A1D3CZN2_9EIME|nr:hypothetical protein cyc_03395 [Cyclospora cayetanensis]